jgi:uncharacterized protein YqeY
MGLKDDVSRDMAVAAKAGEKLKLSTLRLALSALKYKEVDLRRPVTDDEARQVISTLIRQRHDSVEQFTKGNRLDLADKEEKEIEILRAYMPPQLSRDELIGIVSNAASEIGAATIKDMGALMKAVMPLLKGKADGKDVNEAVKKVLGG